ncbi:MAG: hypothetical protein CMF52_02780 [Legionellales bacterium]|nr:hypothetical protein [Legionellales bacterium]|tara:strand:- start:1917 stop:2180 length:264 start_codon:yes stop_codon:yes gene_type:complete
MANITLTPSERKDLEQTKKECLEHLLEIECKLSPENLTCDGELSRSEINRRYRILDEARKTEIKNFKMITHMLEGTPREPTFNEIWD